jgi:hypothetical protein
MGIVLDYLGGDYILNSVRLPKWVRQFRHHPPLPRLQAQES